jgi:hypothetical protein
MHHGFSLAISMVYIRKDLDIAVTILVRYRLARFKGWRNE